MLHWNCFPKVTTLPLWASLLELVYESYEPTKLWDSYLEKNWEFFGFLGNLKLGSFFTTLMQPPLQVIKYVTWKEVVAFLQAWAIVCIVHNFLCIILAPTYAINPLFWFVQVDGTLNSHLWIRPNPIMDHFQK